MSFCMEDASLNFAFYCVLTFFYIVERAMILSPWSFSWGDWRSKFACRKLLAFVTPKSAQSKRTKVSLTTKPLGGNDSGRGRGILACSTSNSTRYQFWGHEGVDLFLAAPQQFAWPPPQMIMNCLAQAAPGAVAPECQPEPEPECPSQWCFAKHANKLNWCEIMLLLKLCRCLENLSSVIHQSHSCSWSFYFGASLLFLGHHLASYTLVPFKDFLVLVLGSITARLSSCCKEF